MFKRLSRLETSPSIGMILSNFCSTTYQRITLGDHGSKVKMYIIFPCGRFEDVKSAAYDVNGGAIILQRSSHHKPYTC